jgi:hypothetical protein
MIPPNIGVAPTLFASLFHKSLTQEREAKRYENAAYRKPNNSGVLNIKL